MHMSPHKNIGLDVTKLTLIRAFKHFILPSSPSLTKCCRKGKVNRAEEDVDLFRNNYLGVIPVFNVSSVDMNQQ